MSQDLILLKLGGSLITDKSTPYTEKKQVIDRLTQEIKNAKQDRDFKLILGHGGGSYPHQSASKYEVQKGVTDQEGLRGISEVQKDASALNKIVFDSLLEKELNPFFVSPSCSLVTEKKEIKEWYLEPLKKALEIGNLPVVYGDVALDLEQGSSIVSTEKLLEHLAYELDGSRIIFCGNTNGVFTKDPAEYPEAEKIDRIDQNRFKKLKKTITGSKNADVTGGMLHKVKRCLRLAERGIECEIMGGKKPGRLERSLKGEKGLGTVFES